MALQLHINVSLNRPPDRTWRHPPGRPRNKWLDQLRNDSTCPIGDLWRRAVDRGHAGCSFGAEKLSGWVHASVSLELILVSDRPTDRYLHMDTASIVLKVALRE